MHADANAEGMRIVRSEPLLVPLELLWRWSFGLGLLALLFLSYTHLRQAILLSGADAAALQSSDPLAMAEAAAAVIAGSQPLLLKMFLQISCAAAVLWVVASTLGRALLTRSLMRRFAAEYGLGIAPDAPRWRAYLALQVARVLTLLILVIGYLGGGVIAAVVVAPGQGILGFVLVLLAAMAVAAVVWSMVNWVLSLAPLFVARDGLVALDAVLAAIEFLRRNRSRLAAVASWNATLRGLAATVITLAGVATLELRFSLPGWMVTGLLALETVIYLVVSDYFLLARLAAYCSVAVRELTLPQAMANPAQLSGPPAG